VYILIFFKDTTPIKKAIEPVVDEVKIDSFIHNDVDQSIENLQNIVNDGEKFTENINTNIEN
jgi:hypothetical protein